jgi:hypothetical protein
MARTSWSRTTGVPLLGMSVSQRGLRVEARCGLRSRGGLLYPVAVHALPRLLILSYWRTAPATLQASCGPRPEPAAEDKDYMFALDHLFVVCEYTVIKTRGQYHRGKETRRD